MKRLSTLALLSMLGACTVGPNYQRPASLPPAQLQLQESLANGAFVPTPLPVKWWRIFDDVELDRLVEQALVKNTDLRIAAANLQRSRALLSEAGAARLPTTDVSAQATRSRTNTAQSGFGQAGGGAIPQTFTTNFYKLGFDASYEIDLFGGVSRSIEAARADVGAAQAAVDASRVSVAAETARAYAQACGYGAQADVARDTESLQARTLDLTQRLFAAGRGTRSQVDQAQVLVEQARAQIPTFEAERRSALYALAVLTGDPPSAIADTPAARCRKLPTPKTVLPVGDGAALLARRPDVRQAERQLAADTARIGVATAALYPSVTLLGSVSLGGTKLGNLGKSSAFGYSVGPLISWNFPFSGAARARVRENGALATRSLASFDGTVLTALKEAEQALARASGAADRSAALSRATIASSDAARLSRLRFDFGADSFLQLVDVERQRASTRADLAQAQSDLADAQISIFKALGGGWEDAPAIIERPGAAH
jgi:NodT family efflux transporter outer membrane factor (OMF) lipoprotein